MAARTNIRASSSKDKKVSPRKNEEVSSHKNGHTHSPTGDGVIRERVVKPDQPSSPPPPDSGTPIDPADPLKGFDGCRLLFQDAAGAPVETKGLVIACPN